MPRTQWCIDLVGQRFGRLVVLERAHVVRRGNAAYWTCLCDCGQQKVVHGNGLRKGLASSCGCFQRERASEGNRTHGLTHSLEYRTWQMMKDRCYNPKANYYRIYGGRGIAVCPRWRDSFESFLADMGPRPTPRHSIDRLNSDGPYEKGNCRWATPMEQGNNKRNNRRLTLNGETKTLAEWCRLLSVVDSTVQARLKAGWSDEEALLGSDLRCRRWEAKEASITESPKP